MHCTNALLEGRNRNKQQKLDGAHVVLRIKLIVPGRSYLDQYRINNLSMNSKGIEHFGRVPYRTIPSEMDGSDRPEAKMSTPVILIVLLIRIGNLRLSCWLPTYYNMSLIQYHVYHAGFIKGANHSQGGD